jgi:hypothetical protein
MGAQVKAGEFFWGGVKSGVVEELERTVEGHGNVAEGGEGGGGGTARNAPSITPSTSTAAADGYVWVSTNSRPVYSRKTMK